MPLTPEQIAQMDSISGLGAKGGATLSPDDIAKMDEITGLGSKQEQPGLMSRVGEHVGDRLLDIRNQFMSGEGGKQNPVENAVNITGDTLAMAGDIAGEGIKSAYGMLPSAITGPIGQGAKAVANYVSDSAVGDVGRDYADKYRRFANENPRAAKLVDSGVNIAVNLPLVKAAPAVAEATGNKISQMGQSLASKSDIASVNKQVTSETLKNMASQAYKAADASGGVIAPQVTTKWLDDAAKVIPQTEEAKLALGPTGATQFLDRIQGLRGKPLSFQAAEEIDKGLGGEISKAFRMGDNTEAARLMGIQDGLREAVQSLPDTSAHVTQAKGLFAASKKLEDIEGIMDRASQMQVPATGIKAGFRTLANNAKRMRGFTPEETAAIKKAAKTGIATDILNVAGSRLGPLVAGGAGYAAGGPLGAAAAGAADYVLSTTARKGAESLQAGRAAKVTDAIMQRPVVQNAVKDAMASGTLSPKFTAMKALGVTLDKTGQLMRGGKPFTMKEALQLSPTVAKTVLDEMRQMEQSK